MMTNRERLIAILEGRNPDRIPWIPRLDIWHRAQVHRGTLPARLQGLTLREVEGALGVGTPARLGSVFRVEYQNMDVLTHDEGFNTITEYVTPRGTVRAVLSRSAREASAGITGQLPTEYPLKSEEDYDIWTYVVENTVYIPTYEEYITYDDEIGNDGLPMVAVGDCPFHHWLLYLAGYLQGYIHLMDFRHRVEALLQVMTEKDREMWKIVAQSPAKLFLHGVHLSSQMTPPRYFNQYITPYYQEFTKLLHTHGKFLAMHADNDTSAILGNIQEAGFNMVECFVTDPMAKVTLKEARDAWGMSVIIWGGIPAIILEENYPEDKFETYIKNIFHTIAPGNAFILGIADNAMADSILSRIEKITEMVVKYGNYPISKL